MCPVVHRFHETGLLGLSRQQQTHQKNKKSTASTSGEARHPRINGTATTTIASRHATPHLNLRSDPRADIRVAACNEAAKRGAILWAVVHERQCIHAVQAHLGRRIAHSDLRCVWPFALARGERWIGGSQRPLQCEQRAQLPFCHATSSSFQCDKTAMQRKLAYTKGHESCMWKKFSFA